MISSILLVPVDFPCLLAPGVCGSRMPMMGDLNGDSAPWSPCDIPNDDGLYERRGLVVGYRGVLVHEGVERAKRVLTNPKEPGGWWWTSTPQRLRKWLAGDMCATYLIHPQTPVRVVLLGADDREVAYNDAYRAYREAEPYL